MQLHAIGLEQTDYASYGMQALVIVPVDGFIHERGASPRDNKSM